MFIKNYSQEFNIISFLYSWILLLVKCNSFLYEKIIYFVLSALIQIRSDVKQLLTLLSSWLRVNENFRAFLSGNEIDRVLSSAYSKNLNKVRRVWQIIYNNRINNGPRTDPCGTKWLIDEEEEVISSITVIWFISLKFDLSHSCETDLIT